MRRWGKILTLLGVLILVLSVTVGVVMAIAGIGNVADKAFEVNPTAEQYYDAAMSILAREGAAGLKIGPLCRSLGVTSGSFYHHFGGWAGFVRGLLRYWEAEQTDRIVELARATADPVERIDVVKQLTVALRHDAEAADRQGDEVVAGEHRVTAIEVGHAHRDLRTRLGELVERRDERFGHEAPSEGAEVRADLFAQTHVTAKNSWRVATGSPPVTRASPTRTTSAPARR